MCLFLLLSLLFLLLLLFKLDIIYLLFTTAFSQCSTVATCQANASKNTSESRKMITFCFESFPALSTFAVYSSLPMILFLLKTKALQYYRDRTPNKQVIYVRFIISLNSVNLKINIFFIYKNRNKMEIIATPDRVRPCMYSIVYWTHIAWCDTLCGHSALS